MIIFSFLPFGNVISWENLVLRSEKIGKIGGDPPYDKTVNRFAIPCIIYYIIHIL